MPYSLQYKKLIQSETKVSKSRLKPRKIYKITTYKYSDGHQKTLSGANTTYIFCTGVFHKKLYGIKLSLVKPEKFFTWLKQVFKRHLTEEDFQNHVNLADFLKLSDKAGTKIFNWMLSNNPPEYYTNYKFNPATILGAKEPRYPVNKLYINLF